MDFKSEYVFPWGTNQKGHLTSNTIQTEILQEWQGRPITLGQQVHIAVCVISVLKAFPGHRDRHGEFLGTSFKIQSLKDQLYCLLPKMDFRERCLYNCISSTFQKKEFLLHIPHLSKMHCPEERDDPEAKPRRFGHSFHQSSINVTLILSPENSTPVSYIYV